MKVRDGNNGTITMMKSKTAVPNLGMFIPCPVTTSSAIFFIVITIIIVVWILYRFFSTFGLADMKAKSEGFRKKPEMKETSSTTSKEEQEVIRNPSFSESSEEFPLRPTAPLTAKSPLLRIIITLTQIISIILLFFHFLLGFLPSYRICRGQFGRLIPFLEDQVLVPSHSALIRANLIRNTTSSLRSPITLSLLLLDLSRGFMIMGLILLLTHFSGAVHRRIPPALSRGGYFPKWQHKMIIIGYSYTPLSIIIVIILQIVPTTLSAQFFLNFEIVVLFIISGIISGLFCRKRFKQINDVVSQSFTPDDIISSNNIFSKQKNHVLLCKKYTTEFFGEMTFILSFALFVHVAGSSFSYYYYHINETPPSPWVMSLLYWMQYITMPFIMVLIIVLIYPREDASITWKLYMDAWNPLFPKNKTSIVETDITLPSPALASQVSINQVERLHFYNNANAHIHKLSSSNFGNSMSSFSSIDKQRISPSLLRTASTTSVGVKNNHTPSIYSTLETSKVQSPSTTSKIETVKIQSPLSAASSNTEKKNIKTSSTTSSFDRPKLKVISGSAYYSDYYESVVGSSQDSGLQRNKSKISNNAPAETRLCNITNQLKFESDPKTNLMKSQSLSILIPPPLHPPPPNLTSTSSFPKLKPNHNQLPVPPNSKRSSVFISSTGVVSHRPPSQLPAQSSSDVSSIISPMSPKEQ